MLVCRKPARAWMVLPVLAFVMLAAAPPAVGDVIVLKNGRHIEAWSVEEKGDKVYYETPYGRVGIARDLVERIEKTGGGPSWSAAGTAAVTAAPEAELPALSDADVRRVVADGKVDAGLLRSLDDEARRVGSESANLRAAAAHLLAAQLLYGKNQVEPAFDNLRRALEFTPHHPVLLLQLAAYEVDQQRYTAALEHLQPVLDDPRLGFDAYRLQGWVYYRREEMDRALTAWKHALERKDDAELRGMVEQVERESQAVAQYQERGSGRFLLRYPGQEVASPRLAAAILGALDSQYDAMANEFDVLPREPIIVLLYPNETFYELTRLPPWVDGVYDGKIRVPIQGLVSLTPGLEAVLRHELVHAFVYFKSRGRAPRWLQEGLAQWKSGQTPSVAASFFLPLFERRDGTALARIERAFASPDPSQVGGAYAASWVVVDALEQTYGRGDMERFLERLAKGDSVEGALQAAYRLSLEDFDRMVYDRLR